MKALLFTIVLAFSCTLCQEFSRPSQIQQILQIAGISDESSNLPCDPYLGAVTASTWACSSCGIPYPLGCALSACTIAGCIVGCAPLIKSDNLKEYVTDSNFCGARICRLIQDTSRYDCFSVKALAAIKNGVFTVFPCMAPIKSVTKKTE